MQFEFKYIEKSQEYWRSKCNGVILVNQESHIDIVWQYLCEQDHYWSVRKDVIQVVPKELLEGNNVLENLCVYVGKTDIDDIPTLIEDMSKLGIEVFLYQSDYPVED